MTNPLFSVIIVCGHDADLLKRTLDALHVPDTYSHLEVLVLDNGGRSGREKVVNKAAESGLVIRYFSLPGISKAAAWNTAVRESHADRLAFLDDDSVPAHDWLSAFETSLGDWNIGIVGGPDKAPKDSTIFQRCLDYALTSFIGTLGMRMGTERMGKYYPRPWNMAARKESIVIAGGFDEYFPEAPEVPLMRRMDQIGYRSTYQPDAFVWHRREADFPRFVRRDFRLSMERGRSAFQPGIGNVYSAAVLLIAATLVAGLGHIPGSRMLKPIVEAYLLVLGISGIHAIFTARTLAAILLVPLLLAAHHTAHITGYIFGRLTEGFILR